MSSLRKHSSYPFETKAEDNISLRGDSSQCLLKQEQGVPGSSLVSTQGCHRALRTVFPRSIHSFISYWDGDNRISAPCIQESAGREGDPFSLSLSPSCTQWLCVSVCVTVWLCDCVGLYSCQMGPMLLPTQKTPHSSALILLLVCVQPSTFSLLSVDIPVLLIKYASSYWLLLILQWYFVVRKDCRSRQPVSLLGFDCVYKSELAISC